MKIREGLVLRKIDNEYVIVAEGLEALDLKCMVGVNDAVACLWRKAKETDAFTVEGLVDTLCQEYDVPVDKATQDIEKLLEQWKQIGIVI